MSLEPCVVLIADTKHVSACCVSFLYVSWYNEINTRHQATNDMGFVWMHYECKLFIPKLLLSPHLAYQIISIGQPLCCLYSWKVVYRIYFHFISTKCWMVIHGDVRTKSNKYIHSFLTFRGECICQKPDMWTWTCVHGGDCAISSFFMECHIHMWIRRFTRHPCPVRSNIGSEIG